MAHDVILGLAYDYSAEDLLPFLDSLAATSFDGDLVLFTNRVHPEALALLAERGIQTAPYDSCDLDAIPRRWRRARRRLLRFKRHFPKVYYPGQERIVERTWDCRAVRYFLFARYLRSRKRQIRRVLLTDVRDVVFQGNPFEGDLPGPVCSFEEHPDTPLVRQDWNRWWVEGLYGDAVLEEVGKETILCSGVTLGTSSGVLDYLDTMRHELRLRIDLNGFDQGVHNVLARRGRLPGLRTVRWNQGPVMHLGIAPRDAIDTSEEGLVLTADGTPAAVVHQYDRHPDLARRLLDHWRSGGPSLLC